MLRQIGRKRVRMIEIRFRLDEEIYTDVIEEMRTMAGTKPLAKIMPRILMEWFLARSGEKTVTFMAETGENEGKNDLADSLSSLSFE
jgi:hypothetical protein